MGIVHFGDQPPEVRRLLRIAELVIQLSRSDGSTSGGATESGHHLDQIVQCRQRLRGLLNAGSTVGRIRKERRSLERAIVRYLAVRSNTKR